MTKEYLKMSDYFAGEIEQDDIVILDCGLDTISHAPEEAAAHAINSHDELVAEVERLRAKLSMASDALDEVDRVISEKIKNGVYNLDDISAEVSHAIEQLSRDTN